MNYLGLVAIALMIFFTGCKSKVGCMDPDATNYDMEAEEDDGSCLYPTDPFVGSWSTNDTTTLTTGTTVPAAYSFTIVQTALDEIVFIGLNQCQDSVEATVSGDSWNIPAFTGCNLVSGSGTVVGDVMTYSFVETTFNGNETTSGVATK